MNKQTKLQWAKDFVSYNIKEGVYEPDVLDGMTDEQIIEFANHENDLAEYLVENEQEARATGN